MAASHDARKAYAAARWAALADRLRSITPETVARLALGLGTLAVCGWLAAASWPALAPFAAGLVIAYTVLPLANRLDRFMPRVLAALIAELVALAVLAGVAVLVVPPLVRSVVIVAGQLPTGDQVSAQLDQLQQTLGQLDEPVRSVVLAVSTQVATNLQAVLEGAVNGMAGFVTQQILGFAGTLSFVLGLLVIPAWVLTMVSDDRKIRRQALAVVAPGLRADVLALARIADRGFGTFLRVQVTLAIVTGALVWLGLEGAHSLGIANFPYAIAGAALLGLLQLIPELGFFLGLFPLLLVLAVSGPLPAATALVVYWGAARLASSAVETRVSRGVLDVHPALLIPGIVVLSQFGLIWTLIAAPLIAVGRDLVRYLAGRLADPPQPAGLLPGERPAGRSGVPATVPVPSAYRSVLTAAGAASGPVSASSAAASPRPVASSPTSTSTATPVAAAGPGAARASTLPEPAFTPSSPTASSLQPIAPERSLTP